MGHRDGSAVEAAFRAEVERLHRFFEAWFAGQDRDFGEFDGAMGPSFHLVSPDGRIRDRAEIVSAVRTARASGDVMIEIHNPLVHFDDGALVIGTYEEHQVRAGRATARQSSVVMRRDADVPSGWMWLSVHETWMTEPDGSTAGV